MGIKNIRGNQYFYRNRRVNGRRTTVYFGAGEEGRVRAQIDADLRADMAEDRLRAKAERIQALKDDRTIARVSAVAARGGEALMGLAGFLRHDRGAYRKALPMSTTTGIVSAARPPVLVAVPEKASPDEPWAGGPGMLAAVDAALDGAPGWRALLDAAMADPRSAASIVEIAGDLPGRVADEVVKSITRGNGLAEVAVRRKLDDMRASLAGPNPTAIEVLLAERCAMTWIHLYRLELIREKTMREPLLWPTLDRRLAHASNMHLCALKALAAVRRVDLKQFNYAEGHLQVVN